MKNRRIIPVLIVLLVVTLSCSLFVPKASSTKASSVSGLTPHPSGYVSSVTMAKGTRGDTLDPVDTTTVFSSSSVFHAVVAIKNAPDNTTFEAVWYTMDVGSAAENNSKIESTDLVSSGSRNLDFSLSPASTWPVGTYEVEIYVNGTLDQVVDFSVK